MSRKLTEEDFQRAAKALNVEVAAIKAVAQVESRGDGFLPDGRPVILFERHKFHKFTNGMYSMAHPDISNPKRGGYKGGTAEWNRLNKALELDDEAALKSASWGKFQIMGFNHAACGYPTVMLFVKDMRESEGKQLDAFVKFIKHARLDDELRRKDWEHFAQGYNGADYAANQYHIKLPKAYNLFKRQETVRLGNSFAPVQPETVDESAEEIIQTTEADLLEASPPTNPQSQSEQETPPSLAKVAIEKPAKKGFISSIFKKISALFGGNMTVDAVTDNAQKVGALGLSPQFWTKLLTFLAIASVIYLVYELVNFYLEQKREKEVTNNLIAANSTPENKVVLVDPENIAAFKERGYAIVHR